MECVRYFFIAMTKSLRGSNLEDEGKRGKAGEACCCCGRRVRMVACTMSDHKADWEGEARARTGAGL